MDIHALEFTEFVNIFFRHMFDIALLKIAESANVIFKLDVFVRLIIRKYLCTESVFLFYFFCFTRVSIQTSHL